MAELQSADVTAEVTDSTVGPAVDEPDPNATVYPSVDTRLANMRPSKDLLDYYRTKVSQYDSEFEKLTVKLDSFKIGFMDQERLMGEMKHREDEIVELQRSLSDMQVYLLQEREHVLRLYSENDSLKLRELEDRKKIQHLLSLTGAETRGGDITYFHKEPPAKVIIPQYRPHNSFSNDSMSRSEYGVEDMSLRKAVPSKQMSKTAAEDSLNNTVESRSSSSTMAPAYNTRPCGSAPSRVKPKGNKACKGAGAEKRQAAESRDDVELLHLQIEALQAQMEDKVKLAREQVAALLEDRRLRGEEADAARTRDAARVTQLNEQVRTVQELLHEATKDTLASKAAVRAAERRWINEKDRLLRELDHLREKLGNSQHKKVEVLSESIHDLEVKSVSQKDTIASLQVQLQQSQKLADMYREQIMTLEDEISKVREEGDIGKELFKERTEKMAKRLQMMNHRYESLEQRRNLEVEGFQNDLKLLRGRLKDVERQLYKVTISVAEPLIREDKDMEMLGEVKRTGQRTKTIINDLQSLKAKIYSLEHDLNQ